MLKSKWKRLSGRRGANKDASLSATKQYTNLLIFVGEAGSGKSNIISRLVNNSPGKTTSDIEVNAKDHSDEQEGVSTGECEDDRSPHTNLATSSKSVEQVWNRATPDVINENEIPSNNTKPDGDSTEAGSRTKDTALQHWTWKSPNNGESLEVIEVAGFLRNDDLEQDSAIITALATYMKKNFQDQIPTALFITAPLHHNRFEGSQSTFSRTLKCILQAWPLLSDHSCSNVTLLLTHADRPEVQDDLDARREGYIRAFDAIFKTNHTEYQQPKTVTMEINDSLLDSLKATISFDTDSVSKASTPHRKPFTFRKMLSKLKKTFSELKHDFKGVRTSTGNPASDAAKSTPLKRAHSETHLSVESVVIINQSDSHEIHCHSNVNSVSRLYYSSLTNDERCWQLSSNFPLGNSNGKIAKVMMNMTTDFTSRFKMLHSIDTLLNDNDDDENDGECKGTVEYEFEVVHSGSNGTQTDNSLHYNCVLPNTTITLASGNGIPIENSVVGLRVLGLHGKIGVITEVCKIKVTDNDICCADCKCKPIANVAVIFAAKTVTENAKHIYAYSGASGSFFLRPRDSTPLDTLKTEMKESGHVYYLKVTDIHGDPATFIADNFVRLSQVKTYIRRSL